MGRKGTVVSRPHWEQIAEVSTRPEGGECLLLGRRSFGRGWGPCALVLADLTAFGFVSKFLVVVELLFASGEYEVLWSSRRTSKSGLEIPAWHHPEKGKAKRVPPASPAECLFDFPATLLPVSFPGERLLHPQLLSRLQVEGVTASPL